MINLWSNDIHHPDFTSLIVSAGWGIFQQGRSSLHWEFSRLMKDFRSPLEMVKNPSLESFTWFSRTNLYSLLVVSRISLCVSPCLPVSWLIWFNLTKCPRYWRIPDSLSITRPDQFNNDVELTKQKTPDWTGLDWGYFYFEMKFL